MLSWIIIEIDKYMKRKSVLSVIILLALLCLLAACGQQSKTTAWTEYNLSDEVEYIEVRGYKIVQNKMGDVEKGARLNIQHPEAGAMTYSYNVKFSHDGLVCDRELLNSKDQILCHDEKKYSELGHCLGKHTYNEKGELESFSDYRYREGVLVSHCVYSADSLCLNKEYYGYEPDGKIAVQFVTIDNKTGTYSHIYNKGKLVEAWYGEESPDFPYGFHLINTYNEYGEVEKKIQEIYTNTTVLTYTYQYSYDEHKNWVTRIDYLNGMPSAYVERNIVYF